MTPPTAAPAGHAHHFLSRLERLSSEKLRAALSLYMDAELLRFVLDRAVVRRDVERVALSLGHPERGPFVIVTRAGDFVTCLGRDMSSGPWPVVTRAEIEAHAARAAQIRARGGSLSDPATRREEALRRMLVAADECAREELEEALAAAPSRAALAGMAAQAAKELEEMRAALVPYLRRTQHPGALVHSLLHAYWKLAFAVGHLSVLLGAGGAGLADEVPALLGEEGPMLSLLALQQGIVGVAVKGIWAAARVGAELYPGYARAFATARGQLQIADAALGLTALGLRHAGLRDEVMAALGVDRAADRDGETRALAEALGEQGRAVLADPAGALALHLDYGARRVVRQTCDLPEGSPWRFTRAADVPERLAMTAGALLYQDFIGDTRHLFGMFALLPWLARASAADLYLPAQLVRVTRAPFRPADAVAMLGGHVARPPARVRPLPCRAAPCPCGSRKKFRRCCGEEGRAADLPKAA
jgi:hypothetical protein